jgi:alkanesulfonate monooxygenase SsuD/methylene tetrahydromethanopterin reductase-like flavin-dependent oxidoreductase (luciferase family)
VTFDGEYYQLRAAQLLPKPLAPGRPPILIGGHGRKHTLPLAARWADEWNCAFQSPEAYRDLNQYMDGLIEAEGRDSTSVRRSVMTNILYGRDQADLERKVRARGSSLESERRRPIIVGAGDEILPQLEAYQQAGVQRIMLQWLELDDLDGIASLAKIALPAFPTQ